MKNKLYIFIALIFGLHTLGNAQNVTSNNMYSIPQEEVFVHYNNTFLLTGEKLLYKIYCINSETKKLSELSKIAYIELIDKNSSVRFRHKVKLNSGLGQGDYFIPPTIPSGNYKIVAYTRWMLNVSKDNFFHADISILNPYNDSSSLTEQDDDVTVRSNTTSSVANDGANDIISLSLPKTSYESRERVELNIAISNTELANGNYSISARKVDSIGVFLPSSLNYQLESNTTGSQQRTANLLIPEFRGELISGKVIDTSTGEVASDVNVAISIPGKDYVFKVSKTHPDGSFYFNIYEYYDAPNATIQVVEDNPENFEIILDKAPELNYEKLDFQDFTISTTLKEELSKRGIHSQIENAFYEQKQDLPLPQQAADRFYGANHYTYLLDDYKRFPTIRETMTEFVKEIFYSRRGDNYYLNLHSLDASDGNTQALVTIDGVLILDHSKIIDMNPENIEKISIIRENYSYGTKIFKGIIAMETFNGDYKNLLERPHIKNITLQKPLVPRNYYNQDYGTNNHERIPDMRNQLFWEPNIQLNAATTTVVFYTSDDPGLYEIVMEGFTNVGNPVSKKLLFEVR